MKFYQALEAGIKKYPEIKQCHKSFYKFAEDSNQEICACAIGMAVLGAEKLTKEEIPFYINGDEEGWNIDPNFSVYDVIREFKWSGIEGSVIRMNDGGKTFEEIIQYFKAENR